MSRLRDIPHVWKHVGPWTFLKRLYNQTYEDNLLVWAAALAFSWLFALFPFLIFCLSLIPLLPAEVAGLQIKPTPEQVQQFIDAALVTGEDPVEAADKANITTPEEAEEKAAEEVRVPEAPSTQEAITTQPADIDPEAPGTQTAPITRTIGEIVEGILTNPSGSRLTISIIIALFTASGGIAMTMAGLDQCYDVAYNKMRPVWISRPIAILLTIVMAIMILLAVILIPGISLLLNLIGRYTLLGVRLEPFVWLINPLRYALAILLLLGVLALVYRWGPSLRTRMHLFSPGSVFCVIMWLLTAWGFRIYLDSFGAAASYERTYGALAGVAVLMFLFYLDALFLLIGAEINSEIDFIRLGIRSGPLPEEQEVAPVPPYELDEEDRELKEELEDRRSVDLSPEAIAETEHGDGAGI